MTYNAMSLRNSLRRDIIEAQSEVENFDVLVLTESWLTESFLDSHISLTNYTVAARAERKEPEDKKSPGGGVIIYVKNSIKFHSPVCKSINEYTQVASVKIKDLRIVGVYRKPAKNTTFDENSKNYIQSTFSDQNVVLTGDFNLPGVDWDKDTFKTKSEQTWVNMKNEMGLHQFIRGTTRPLTGNGNHGNCLDLVFSRSSHSLYIENVIIDPRLISLSDHHCVHFVANTVFTKEVKKKIVYDVKNADWECYKNTMKLCKVIPKTVTASDPTLKWEVIESSILLSKDKSCQKKEVIQGKSPRWISENLQKALKKDQKLRKKTKLKAKSSVRRARINKWQFHHQKLKVELKRSRVKFESDKILGYEKDHKALFRDIKKARSINVTSPPINDLDGSVLTTDKEKAEALQTKFVKVFTPLQASTLTWPEINGGLNDIVFSNAKIKESIKSLKSDSAAGSDNIGPVFYKNADLSLIFALSDLYQSAFDNCDLPEKFLLSKCIAIWKQKGLISDILMYRCITLMCIGFKIMEKIINKDIVQYLIANDLNDCWQHGFQSNKSTVTNLVDTWEFISKKLDNKENWITLSVDLSSAFDSLSIAHLMIALQAKGIGGKLGKFLHYWLTNRTQYVQVGDSVSRPEKCSSGVPQGSCGGPNYFSILISHVYQNLATDGAGIQLKFWAFADDTRLAFKAETAEKFAEAQTFMNNFAKSLNDVGLKLNPSKSIMVYYGNQRYKGQLQVDGIAIPVEKSSLELGCIFSNNMSFKPSIERNISKARAFIFTIRNTMKVRNYSVLKKLYTVYLSPILLYCCQVWHSHNKYVKDELHSVFRKFWRLGLGKVTPGPEIMDPFQLSIKHILVFLFKIRQNKTCFRSDELFQESERTMTRSDNALNLKINSNRLVSRDGFFTTLAAKWFNELPNVLKAEKSLGAFKKGVTDYIIETHPTPPFDYRPWYKRPENRQVRT